MKLLISFSVPELQRRLHRVRGRQCHQISLTTIHRRLHRRGLYGRWKCKKQFLTTAHKADRHQWVRVHRRWTRQHWQQGLFSDETRIYLRGNDGGSSMVFRRRGEVMLPTASNLWPYTREVASWCGEEFLAMEKQTWSSLTETWMPDGTFTRSWILSLYLSHNELVLALYCNMITPVPTLRGIPRTS